MKYLVWISDVTKNTAEVIGALQSQDVEVDVLLLQDGVFMADKGNENSSLLKKLGVGIHALESHVKERGISNRLVEGVKLVNYRKMLELIMEKSDKVFSI
ncbi:sulfurtransferase complex subunit TusB [Candidatus Thorarchaeota archaeon]|nr:MAG: sulfurtransferase complex subunit TusB [Candidatus Thorarchaeota archaeon]